ncbi:hypothetical protein AAZX31_11G199000 [Glycine max]
MWPLQNANKNTEGTTRHNDDEGEGLSYHLCRGQCVLHHDCVEKTCLAPPGGETQRRHVKEKHKRNMRRRNVEESHGVTGTNATPFGYAEKKKKNLAQFYFSLFGSLKSQG